MRFLIVHPLMSAMGGGERLSCETMRALLEQGHELTLLSGEFEASRLERFFGYEGLFARLEVKTYPANSREGFGTYKHILHHARAQQRLISEKSDYDIIFSTQDAGYFPDISRPVLQWGYFPNSLPQGLYGWPMRLHYSRKIRRIGLLLAISEYSKSHFDEKWNVSTMLVYPACNMIQPGRTRGNVVVTAARAVPEKHLELFWEVARECPRYKFILLMTQDPRFVEYSTGLQRSAPDNGTVIQNPNKEIYQTTLASSRIYLHLMKGEHFGITIAEAMSAGCVPVVHDSGGPKEIVGTAGFFWRTKEDIPELLRTAETSFDSLSNACAIRAKVFSRERFDARLAEVIGSISERLP